MRIKNTDLNHIEILDRICEVYGFTQKIQLANHFDIAASSLSNRYTRGTISYDFAASCAMETGANIYWILTGKGEKFSGEGVLAIDDKTIIPLKIFSLSEGKLVSDGDLSIDPKLFTKPLSEAQCVKSDGKTHFIEQGSSLSDGLWLVEIEGAISIRELTVLPAKKLHVAGGKVPFECGVDEIKILGRVVGIYSEIN
ncbi:phage repressor protein CI [Yersinia pseudotuberculosis]|uniref:phage repressor protein CI n=1 Tax=Yersinia pseudotuberculosis TaxID=633 RepID=UPI0005775041|nr:phage repressor protein CI [Yersinia pseudotuberculosis]CQD59155.1 CI repressor [Yersinia intermedia]MBO1632673.1 phage repressor protein CI [Yersinia pseudotuberculosis]MBP0071148.1 phage repressor protein CI [Yersinia pseudotuberculosis]MCF1164723.1 helix-turn-helix domain-containing protein [Yersinia pseudotuberculosis]PSH18434.1 repressor [Yersinia pseudotuberculosis]